MYEMKNSLPCVLGASCLAILVSAGLATVLFSSEATRNSAEGRILGSQKQN